MLSDECPLNFYLLAEDHEPLKDSRARQFAVHHLKNGLELVTQFRHLHICVDQPQVNYLGEPFNRLLDNYTNELVPQLFGFLRVVSLFNDLVKALLYHVESLLLLEPVFNQVIFAFSGLVFPVRVVFVLSCKS